MANPRSYQQHVHTVHELEKFGANWTPNRPLTINCLQCDKKFADQEALNQHQISKHSSINMDELAKELPDVFDQRQLDKGDKGGLLGSDYEYVACQVCGQSCSLRC